MDQTAAPRVAVGVRLAGRYRLERLIARGGMADVYEAEDERLQRRVAVKAFRAGPSADRVRFDGEVRVLAALDHPNLVRVYDAGEHDGQAFVVLELVDGPTLAARAAEGPLLAREVAEIGAAIADALAYVHERDIVHRDVTPSNVLCAPDGRPRLADFGIARLVDATRLTATQTTIGTAAYMAPEQVQGHAVRPAADVYALGLVLLELLTNRRGFEGTAQEVAVARLVRPPDTTTGVPGPWRALLASMTERAPANRPAAASVRDRLRDLAAAVDPVDQPTGAVGAVAATIALAPEDGRTAVLPAALAPAASPGMATVRSAAGGLWARRGLLVALALVAVVALAAFASGGGVAAPPPVREPVAATSSTVAPATTASTATTIAPATTAAPPVEGQLEHDEEPKKQEKKDGSDDEGDDD